jgi:hypothetical protein
LITSADRYLVNSTIEIGEAFVHLGFCNCRAIPDGPASHM